MLAINARLALLAALFGCGASEKSPGAVEGVVPPAPAQTPTTTTPGAPAPAAASPQDAGATFDGPAPSSRARCGAAPYEWLPATNMGAILEKRSLAPHTPIELNLLSLSLHDKKAMDTRRIAQHSTNAKLVRYVTQDRGAQAEATALVTYPSGVASPPILLFLHGTVGFNDSCSPTRPLAEADYGGFTDEMGVLIGLLASYGYVVVFPDYLGLKSFGPPSGMMHPYLVGEPTAIASLDAVRATKKLLADEGLSHGDLVIAGASQGGHAAAFVDRYAPHYAPEIVPKGAVWMVPPSDLVAHGRAALATQVKATANMVAFFTTADSWYRASPNGLAGVFLPPYDSLAPVALGTTCSADFLEQATLPTLFTSVVLSASQNGFANADPWSCYANENSVPSTSVPRLTKTPTLFLTSERDNLVDTVIERASFQTLCGQGYDLSYLECAEASHAQSFSHGWDDWLDFLAARLDGTPVTGACQISAPRKCASSP